MTGPRRSDDELKEPLRRAFGATLRILAARPDPPGGPALLAALPDAPDAAARSLWRGRIDALALRTRLSDAALHARTAPVEARRQALFDALEQARVEALGAILPGVRANLAQFPRPAPAEGALLLRAARARWGAPATRMEAADAISLPQAALEAPPIGPAARKIDAIAALPHLLRGMKLSAGSAMIGAIIGEWFGAPSGLGVVVLNSMQNFQISLLWAAGLVITALTLAAYALLTLGERMARGKLGACGG